MCSVYVEPDLVRKPGLNSGGSWIRKNVIKLELKASNFGRTWLKHVPGQSSHKVLIVRIKPEVLSKMKNRTTLALTYVVILFSIWKIIVFTFFVLLHWIRNISFFFFNQENLKNNWKTFSHIWTNNFFQIPEVHQLMRSPILISIKWLLL